MKKDIENHSNAKAVTIVTITGCATCPMLADAECGLSKGTPVPLKEILNSDTYRPGFCLLPALIQVKQ